MIKYHKQILDILKFLSTVNKKRFSEKDIERLCAAVLTPSEIEAISQRIHVLELLFAGKSQREVSEILGVGVATATRGNRMLKENFDLFERILSKK
ncbi:MAG: Trp family transcriptional regulator [Bdellovibrionota bacterium]